MWVLNAYSKPGYIVYLYFFICVFLSRPILSPDAHNMSDTWLKIYTVDKLFCYINFTAFKANASAFVNIVLTPFVRH